MYEQNVGKLTNTRCIYIYIYKPSNSYMLILFIRILYWCCLTSVDAGTQAGGIQLDSSTVIFTVIYVL